MNNMFKIFKKKVRNEIVPLREVRQLAHDTADNLARYMDSFNSQIKKAASEGRWSVHTSYPCDVEDQPTPIANRLIAKLREAGYQAYWRNRGSKEHPYYSILINWD